MIATLRQRFQRCADSEFICRDCRDHDAAIQLAHEDSTQNLSRELIEEKKLVYESERGGAPEIQKVLRALDRDEQATLQTRMVEETKTASTHNPSQSNNR